MVELNEIKTLVDDAMGSAKSLYDIWYHDQSEIWPNFQDSVTDTCYNSHSTAIIFQGTGRECALLIDAIDKELYSRGIEPWCTYVNKSLEIILPKFIHSDMYAIWVNYAGKGKWSYGIDKVGYFI